MADRVAGKSERDDLIDVPAVRRLPDVGQPRRGVRGRLPAEPILWR